MWNRTSVADWQAGYPNVLENQNFHLTTPAQSFELPTRENINGLIGGGNSGQSDFTLQGSYGVDFHRPKWYTVLYGRNIPSPLQGSLRQSQLSYQPSSTLAMAGQSASSSHAPSWNPSTLYQGLTSGKYLATTSLGQDSLSSAQSVATINRIPASKSSIPMQVSVSQSASTPQGSYGAEFSQPAKWYTLLYGERIPSSQGSGIQSQLSYQPSTTVQVSESQSASTPQAQGSYGAGVSQPAKWYTLLYGEKLPSPLQVSGIQSQLSYQPRSVTQVLTGQSASSQGLSLGASTLFPSKGSGRYTTLQGLNPPSSQSGVATNQVFGSQSQPSSQPSTAMQESASQSAYNAPAQGRYGAESSRPAKWYSILYSRNVPSLTQASGIQSQTSYQSSSITQDLVGQSASSAHALDVSALYQGLTSGRYNFL